MGRTCAGTILAVVLALAAGNALAHNSKLVHTDERNGMDLAIRRAGEKETVPGLEAGLKAEIVSPDGTSRRDMVVRPRYGHPGRYTFDVMLTQPGAYSIRVWGTIDGNAFDETFELSEARPLTELRFPG